MTTQSEQKNLFFVHTPHESWNSKDLDDIYRMLKSFGYEDSVKAAIGEGAGGPGWETIIEVVLTSSAVASLTEQLWRLAKFLITKRPKQKAPNGREIYKLVVHLQNRTILSIDLNSEASDIETAILNNLNQGDIEKYSRLYQEDDTWRKY